MLLTNVFIIHLKNVIGSLISWVFFVFTFSPLLKKDYWVFAWRKRGLGDNHSTWTERKIGWLWFWSQGSKFLWWNDVINRQNFFFSFLSWEKANLSPLSHRPRPNPKTLRESEWKEKIDCNPVKSFHFSFRIWNDITHLIWWWWIRTASSYPFKGDIIMNCGTQFRIVKRRTKDPVSEFLSNFS